jgi:hypothetical protein
MTTLGIVIGGALALTWVLLGFWAFLFVAVAIAIAIAMLIWGLVGRIVEGRLDVSAVADAFRGKRSSS